MVKYYYSCDGEMTFEKLSKLIKKYDIPHDVTLLSDSGWECDPTSMRGVRYNKNENVIVFTQDNGFTNGRGVDMTKYETGFVNLTLLDE